MFWHRITNIRKVRELFPFNYYLISGIYFAFERQTLNMKLTQHFTIFLIVLLSFSFACKKSEPPQEGAVSATLNDYTGFDGCSWVIKLENNVVLEPVNLQDFGIELKEGKEIWVKYTAQNDLASICMVGPIVRIDAIWER